MNIILRIPSVPSFRVVDLYLCCVADGNGFKTSVMRLGADVIVFTRQPNNKGYEWITHFTIQELSHTLAFINKNAN